MHLIFVEHPHVYTFGKHAKKNHLLATPEMLQRLGADVFEIERGGDITYHGPGQLVVYPIFDLEQLNIGIKQYVARVEECILEVVAQYGIEAGTINDRIGVWLDINGLQERKIAAIGIKSSRYVTMHGLALNVNTDLDMFNHIVPCGIPDKAVTSISKELNEEIDFFEVNLKMRMAFERIFELQFL
jgi:lipoyl(octanoyl) transferase